VSRFLGPCLAFAGACLLGAAAVGVLDWAVCVRSEGWSACRASRADAVAALTGAAASALGVALQERQP
jgi:hypothetical protein